MITGNYHIFYGSLRWAVKLQLKEDLSYFYCTFMDKETNKVRNYEVHDLQTLAKVMREFADSLDFSVFDRRLASYLEDYLTKLGVLVDGTLILEAITDKITKITLEEFEIKPVEVIKEEPKIRDIVENNIEPLEKLEAKTTIIPEDKKNSAPVQKQIPKTETITTEIPVKKDTPKEKKPLRKVNIKFNLITKITI